MNFYDKLAATPLFQGLTSSDLIQIIGQTKFSFYKFASDKTIRNEGEPCRSMAFLLSGTARMVTYADDHGFSVEETVTAPCILQPERLFGLTQRYTRNFIAASSCAIMEIDKNSTILGQGLDIPGAIDIYNDGCLYGDESVRSDLAFVAKEKKPDQCTKCGMCEEKCPQHLPIRRILDGLARIIK